MPSTMGARSSEVRTDSLCGHVKWMVEGVVDGPGLWTPY